MDDRKEITIRMTLNKETRDMKAIVVVRGDGAKDLFAGPVNLVTSHGKKTHRGSVFMKFKECGEYSSKDILSIHYSGMRGNGTGQLSTFRYIGFVEA